MTLSNHDFPDGSDQARSFDPDALGQAYDHFYGQIYRYVVFRLGSEQTGREITTQVFIDYLETLNKKPKTITNTAGWLLEAARSRVDQSLRATREGEAESKPIQPEPHDHTPAEEEAAWLSRLMQKSLRKLTLDQQHLLALRFALLLAPDETARRMERSISEVKSLQADALLALRQWLEQDA